MKNKDLIAVIRSLDKSIASLKKSVERLDNVIPHLDLKPRLSIVPRED